LSASCDTTSVRGDLLVDDGRRNTRHSAPLLPPCLGELIPFADFVAVPSGVGASERVSQQVECAAPFESHCVPSLGGPRPPSVLPYPGSESPTRRAHPSQRRPRETSRSGATWSTGARSPRSARSLWSSPVRLDAGTRGRASSRSARALAVQALVARRAAYRRLDGRGKRGADREQAKRLPRRLRGGWERPAGGAVTLRSAGPARGAAQASSQRP
jgi:hypothetical protein